MSKNITITKPQKVMLATIKKYGPQTDAGLAEINGGSPSSKYKTAEALVAKGLLVKDGANYALAVETTQVDANTVKADVTEPVDVTDETASIVDAVDAAIDHEAVAADMAAELESGKGESIRVAKGILAAIALLDYAELPDAEGATALVERLDAAEVKTDGSVRIDMVLAEREVLADIAEAILDAEGSDGATKTAARALVKWLAKFETAA